MKKMKWSGINRVMRVFKPVYDDPVPPAVPPVVTPPANPPVVRTFTQEEVNGFLAKERAADKQKAKELLAQLEAANSKVNMTSQEKENFEHQLEELRQKSMTQEEIAARERKKIETQLTKERDEAKNAMTAWQRRFEDSTIRRTLMDAAVANEAFAPNQVVSILASNAKVVELSDDNGKPKGEFDVIVKFQDVGKDGKPIMLELPANEVVKRMKELSDTYGNLFKNGVLGGTGSNNGKGGKAVDASKMTPAEYKVYREQLKKEGKL